MKGAAACLVLLATALSAQAIRPNAGFRSESIPANDDGSGPMVPLGFTINFFGRLRSAGWVNNNGNITFDSPLATFTPFGLENTQREIVAAFFADVDTRPAGSALVTYGRDTVDGRRAFGANYVSVGYFDTHAEKLNSFQIVIIEREDTGAGNFDLEFNYQRIAWETGDASGGANGLGGVPAVVGWSNGSGAPGTSFELAGSLIPGSFLDSGPYSLVRNRLNSTVTGRFVFRARDGQLRPPLTIATGCPLPAASAGQPYLTALGAIGGGSTLRWSAQPDPGSSAFPPGLTMNSDGVISGRADQPGAWEFTLRLVSSTEDGEETAVRRCSLTVAPAVLTITSACPLPGATVGQLYRRTLQVSGGRAPFQWSLADGSTPLPEGLALDASGVISGVPAGAGTRVLQLRVGSNPADGAEPATKTCAITVAPSVQAVQATACTLPPATVGVPYSQILESNGVDEFWSAAGGLPSGLALTGGGRIEGVPTLSGTSRLLLRTGAGAERACVIEVREPSLRVGTACPLPAGRTGQSYSADFSVTGGDGSYTWSSIGTLPPGLTLSAAGRLDGIPDAAGNFAFRVLVSDATGNIAASGCNVTVLRSSFAITSCPLPDATVGIDYTRGLNVEGGAAPYVFSTVGAFPSGLSLSSTGRVSGRPTEAGTWSPQIRVTDRAGNTLTQRCPIAVAASPIRIRTSCPLASASVAAPYTQHFEASGGRPPYRWRVTGALPQGLDLTSDGVVRGTATAPSSSEFVIEAADAAGNRTTLRCSLEAKLPPFAEVRLAALPSTVQPAEAGPVIAIELSRAYLLPVTGTLVLGAEADTGTADPAVNRADPVVRFRNGQRTVRFAIPAGSTSFSTSILSTGTVASLFTVRATELAAGSVRIPVNPSPLQFRIPRTEPVLTSACIASATSGSEIRLEGYSTTRHLEAAEMTGLPAISLSEGSRSYFSGEDSIRTGGAFSLVFPAPVGLMQTGVSVATTNSVGRSAERPLENCR